MPTSGFTWDFSDLQVQGFDPAIGFFLDNAGKASNDGFELELLARPVEGLDLNLTAGYLDAKYDFYVQPFTGLDLSGNKQPHSPEWALSAGGQYTFQLKNARSLTFRAESQNRDEFFLQSDNTFKHEAFTLINAAVFLASADDHWRFTLYGKNLTDEQTFGFRGSNTRFSPDPANSNLVAVGEPRQWGFRVEFNY